MPKEDSRLGNRIPDPVRYVALATFVIVILYKMTISKEVIPDWMLFTLVAMVAGGNALNIVIEKIASKILGSSGDGTK